MGFRVWGLGFRVSGLGLRVQDLGLRHHMRESEVVGCVVSFEGSEAGGGGGGAFSGLRGLVLGARARASASGCLELVLFMCLF